MNDNECVETNKPLIGTQLIRINNDFMDLDHLHKSGVADIGWIAAWCFFPILLFMIVGFYNPDLFQQGNPDFQKDFLMSIGLPLFASSFFCLPTIVYSALRITKVSSCRFNRKEKLISLRYRSRLFQVAWKDLEHEFKKSSVAYSGASYRKSPTVTFDLFWKNPRTDKLKKYTPVFLEDERREYWMSTASCGTEKELWQAVVLFMESGPGDINILPEPNEVQVIQLGHDDFEKSMERISPHTPSKSPYQFIRGLTVILKLLAYVPGVFANLLWFSIIRLLSNVDKKLPGDRLPQIDNVTQKMVANVVHEDEKYLTYKEVLIRCD